jgi:hypothetical protein
MAQDVFNRPICRLDPIRLHILLLSFRLRSNVKSVLRPDLTRFDPTRDRPEGQRARIQGPSSHRQTVGLNMDGRLRDPISVHHVVGTRVVRPKPTGDRRRSESGTTRG